MLSTKWFVVAEDEHCYNVFSSDDFDAKGRYIENPDYNIGDMDIVATFNSADAAFDFADSLAQ